jgi:hypothetical protein
MVAVFLKIEVLFDAAQRGLGKVPDVSNDLLYASVTVNRHSVRPRWFESSAFSKYKTLQQLVV